VPCCLQTQDHEPEEADRDADGFAVPRPRAAAGAGGAAPRAKESLLVATARARKEAPPPSEAEKVCVEGYCVLHSPGSLASASSVLCSTCLTPIWGSALERQTLELQLGSMGRHYNGIVVLFVTCGYCSPLCQLLPPQLCMPFSFCSQVADVREMEDAKQLQEEVVAAVTQWLMSAGGARGTGHHAAHHPEAGSEGCEGAGSRRALH
jgi:hypothetical protein